MKHGLIYWSFGSVIMLTIVVESIQVDERNENGMKSAVFLSPEFALEPGAVSNKFHYDIEFPRGHIAVKDFYAEVVDEFGKSVPLHETYLHHWLIVRYYRLKGVPVSKLNTNPGFQQSNFIVVGNSGICGGLVQYFGLGSETRRTETRVPDPYGIEVGNPLDIPPGYEEGWLLNVHAIDTRGAEDRLGCTECRCNLYNVTVDEYGRPVQPDYIGGLRCCYDQARCRVKEGFQGVKRSLFLKYNVTYLEWDNSIVPVQIYIFDVTDTWKNLNDSTRLGSGHHCQIEYRVDSCSAGSGACTDTRSVSVPFPTGGDVIYGAAHQHTGGAGSTLYGEDGRVICSSTPIYGEGDEPGNEAGYVVGMTTCYPRPGTVKIHEGEMLTLVSNYSGIQRHTGVMGLFYILVADSSPHQNSTMHSLMVEKVAIHNAVWIIPLLVSACVVAAYRRKRSDSYESILMS
ncbi:hypothetical protein Leryth_016915 [Lithospermum erythrorhizon]|nr:hypothetical protein Leryth_016915 [Lithospermum erythrorhizon]